MVQLSRAINIPEQELAFVAIRAQGAGGQNVNKVSSAVHLRFDIRASSLPEVYKERLLRLSDRRISSDGVLVIKAQRFRTREKNREDALDRLQRLLQDVARVPKARRPTRPSRAARQKRVDNKTQRGRVKALRGRVKL